MEKAITCRFGFVVHVSREGVVCHALSSNDAIVTLDLEIDEELENEGRARDIIRVVQQARREADLHVSDRIELILDLGAEWAAAVDAFGDYIASQTLASSLATQGDVGREGWFVHEAKLGGSSVRVGLAKAG